MPKVTFVTDKITVEVPVGAAIPDIVDQCGATLPFGCRMGSCGNQDPKSTPLNSNH